MHSGQSLIQIFDNVGGMFDTDADPDHLRPDAGLALLVRCHLPMRGRGRMAGERFRIADIDQPFDEPQRVVKRLAGLETALDAEGQQRRRLAAEIFLRQRVIRAVREAA